MIRKLSKKQNISLEKVDIIDLEEKIIKLLDFSLRHVSSIHFLERYLRLFGVDQEKKD